MRVLILEDELPAAERLQAMLQLASPGIEIVGVLETGQEALEYLNSHPDPDVIISDIELADGLCFGVFAELKKPIPVIFATAYNQYAIRAFEANAIDYLLKPIKQEAIEKSLEKLHKRMGIAAAERNYNELANEIVEKRKPGEKKFLVRYGQKMLLINANDASFYHSAQKSSFATMPSGKTYPIDESLNQIEADLDPERYFRINRNLIIRKNSIVDMTSQTKGRLLLRLEPELEDAEMGMVSAERSPQFRKWIKPD
jgi:DNA-binding LytR/AlgR family response regulator